MEYNSTARWIVAYGVVAVCIIFSNLLMTAVFTKSPAVRSMRTALFLMGMTAADLIVGVAAIPMYMAILWEPNRGRIQRKMFFPWRLIEMSSSLVSIFLLAVVALERVYSVFWTYRHRVLGEAPYRWALSVPWLLVALQMACQFLQWYGFMSRVDLFLCIFTGMLAAEVLIVVSYVAIWWKLKTTRVEGLHQRRNLQERKMAKTLAMLTGVFLVTWLPFSALYADRHVTGRLYPVDVLYAFKVLHYANSFMNPAIYSLRIPQVRTAIARMFCWRRERRVAPATLQMEGARCRVDQEGRRGREGGKTRGMLTDGTVRAGGHPH